jgi:hypothetical protein
MDTKVMLLQIPHCIVIVFSLTFHEVQDKVAPAFN